MYQRILYLMLILGLSSCVCKKQHVENFPPKPILMEYSDGPIYNKTENGYNVSDKLIHNSITLTDYYTRIEEWKLSNNIR